MTAVASNTEYWGVMLLMIVALVLGMLTRFAIAALWNWKLEREIRKRAERRVRRPCFICNGSGRRAKLSSAPCSWCGGKGFIFINDSQSGKDS